MECIAQYGSDSDVDEVGKEVGTLDAKRKAKLDSQERRAQERAQMKENTCPFYDRWDDDRTSDSSDEEEAKHDKMVDFSVSFFVMFVYSNL